MAQNFTQESANAIIKGAEALIETVEETIKAAQAYRDYVAEENIQVITDNADGVVDMVTNALAPTFKSGAETMMNTAKVTLNMLRATGNL